MVLTPSVMRPLGSPMPSFRLLETRTDTTFDSKDLGDAPVLVMFICNHCPYVKHIADDLEAITKKVREHGVQVVAISSNSVNSHPEDGPDRMKQEAERRGYTFPYLYDATQEVAKAFSAVCTPDFFLFDGQHQLVYRGQIDDSRPGNGKPVTGKDLLRAVEHLPEPVPDQLPSIGCNIKWHP